MKRILLAEDDALLNRTLTYNLASDGYEVTAALNARAAEKYLARGGFDLALLDVNLPDGSGYELCKLIKSDWPDTVVLFLTANDRESDQLRGYELGAVDYITKPFSVAALRRKIQAMFAMLDRSGPAGSVYDDGRLCLDFAGQRGTLDGAPLSLSALEYRFLELLCAHPDQVLTRGQLLDRLWDSKGSFVDEHTLTTTVSRVRGKIEAGGGTYIKTVYGMGYQWTGGEKK